MGVLRDLKKANEAYWADKITQDALLAEAKRLRLAHWKIQKDAGVDIIPSNDFAFYDHVLDHIQLFNVSLAQQSIAFFHSPTNQFAPPAGCPRTLHLAEALPSR
jgi:hypothetical protein